MSAIAPESVITVSAFRNEAVDMWVPFQIPAEGMQDHDKARSKIHGLVLLGKHTGNNTVNGMEKAVKQGAVIQEKLSEALVNGEDTVPMGDIEEFEDHRGSALHGIFIAASRAETAVASERDELELTAMRAAIHSPAEGRITTMDHLVDIFNDSRTGMEFI